MNNTQRVGTSYYMAPELVNGSCYDEKCDVFSFAMIMYELMVNHVNPYDDTVISPEVKQAQNVAFRPKLPPVQLPNDPPIEMDFPWYIELMKKCWAPEPKERPSFDQIVTELLTNKHKQVN